MAQWFDTDADAQGGGGDDRIDWLRVMPFITMHLACFGVLWVGFSWTALVIAVALYTLRMFALTGFYHRYFSHRAFKTSRTV
ncbi:MAG: acyl-CoA desaturase, partial [Proteobacteria bacterium]|nr:acyl-CoA desaturase [Pseudomonadota bacterium]